jgi:hypothetical protein
MYNTCEKWFCKKCKMILMEFQDVALTHREIIHRTVNKLRHKRSLLDGKKTEHNTECSWKRNWC